MQEREARELEAKIAAWRARLSAALPGREETVRELEGHLRDHIEVKIGAGMTAEAALEEGVARLGEPRAVAREFAQVEDARGPLVWPLVVIYALVGLPVLTLMVRQFFRSEWSALMGAHVFTIFGGYLAMLGAGLVGAWTIISGWRREQSQREIRAQRRALFELAVIGSVLVPVGLVLGMLWDGATHQGRYWSWQPVEVGGLSVLISTWLLLAVQCRGGLSVRVRAVLALLGASVVGIGWFGANAVTAALPISWMCGAAIFSQGAVALLHVRSKRAAEERGRLVGE